ncbi:hypothetical protein ACTGJ9_018335 [Bradyrhizobium sp. RDM12]
MSTSALIQADVSKFLKGLSRSIELDQIYVDSLPREQFLDMYDDSLWRDWRRDHRVFIDKLLASADGMTASALERLTEIALSFDPVVVGRIMQETFAEIVSGSSAEGCETAQHFFEWVAGEVARQGRGKRLNRIARKAMSQWLPAIDPLGIARDPECGYPELGARARAHRINRPLA